MDATLTTELWEIWHDAVFAMLLFLIKYILI